MEEQDNDQDSKNNYIRFEIGDELFYSTDLPSVSEVIFWMKVFESRIMDQLTKEKTNLQ